MSVRTTQSFLVLWVFVCVCVLGVLVPVACGCCVRLLPHMSSNGDASEDGTSLEMSQAALSPSMVTVEIVTCRQR